MSDNVKPITMSAEMLDAIRGMLARNPEHVSKNSKLLLAEVDALRARVAELEAKLADERKVLDVFNVVYEIELASGDDDAEFLRRGGFDARAIARGEFNEWRARRAKEAAE